MKENSGNTPLPRNWLERFLNASTDTDRRVLFEWELREWDPHQREDWWDNEVSWDLTAIGGPDNARTEEFFWYYCLLVQAQQGVAQAMVDNQNLDPTDANRFNNLLDQANLRLASQDGAVKGVLTVSPALPLFLLCSAAGGLWKLASEETAPYVGRCAYQPCKRFFIGSPHREYCSKSCREKASRFGRNDGRRQRQYRRREK
jgi:hypothetical protein